MNFQTIGSEEELSRLWRLRDTMLQETDLAKACQIISELNRAMDINAGTVKQSKELIGQCLAWSTRKLWLKVIGVKVGDPVIYRPKCEPREATILKFVEDASSDHDVHLRYEDGKKPRSSFVSAYSIRPRDGDWSSNAFYERIRGRQ